MTRSRHRRPQIDPSIAAEAEGGLEVRGDTHPPHEETKKGLEACYVMNNFTRLRKQERPMAIIPTTTLPIFPSPAYLLVA